MTFKLSKQYHETEHDICRQGLQLITLLHTGYITVSCKDRLNQSSSSVRDIQSDTEALKFAPDIISSLYMRHVLMACFILRCISMSVVPCGPGDVRLRRFALTRHWNASCFRILAGNTNNLLLSLYHAICTAACLFAILQSCENLSQQIILFTTYVE